MADNKTSSQARSRPCLGGCGKPFKSPSPAVRVCPTCRKRFKSARPDREYRYHGPAVPP